MVKKVTKNKKVLFLLTAIAIVAVGSAVYVKMTRPDKAPTDQEKLQQEERQSGGTDPKTDNESYQRQQNQAQSSSSATTTTATVTLSSLSQDVNNVYVSGIVEKQTQGTCTVRLTSGSNLITKTAPLGLVTNYYACQGFTIPKSEFPTEGDWSVKLDFSNGSAQGSSTTERINVQKL